MTLAVYIVVCIYQPCQLKFCKSRWIWFITEVRCDYTFFYQHIKLWLGFRSCYSNNEQLIWRTNINFGDYNLRWRNYLVYVYSLATRSLSDNWITLFQITQITLFHSNNLLFLLNSICIIRLTLIIELKSSPNIVFTYITLT